MKELEFKNLNMPIGDICVEVCPYCEFENEIIHNTITEGFVVKCKNCGKEIFLCDECFHRGDNDKMFCDWNNGKCFRGICNNNK